MCKLKSIETKNGNTLVCWRPNPPILNAPLDIYFWMKKGVAPGSRELVAFADEQAWEKLINKKNKEVVLLSVSDNFILYIREAYVSFIKERKNQALKFESVIKMDWAKDRTKYFYEDELDIQSKRYYSITERIVILKIGKRFGVITNLKKYCGVAAVKKSFSSFGEILNTDCPTFDQIFLSQNNKELFRLHNVLTRWVDKSNQFIDDNFKFDYYGDYADTVGFLKMRYPEYILDGSPIGPIEWANIMETFLFPNFVSQSFTNKKFNL